MNDRDKLSVEEARALSEILNLYMAKETADYNLKREIFKQDGDLVGLMSTIDEYVEHLSLLQDYLETTTIALRKSKIQLSKHSDTFKRRYLERMYGQEG